MTEYSIGVVLMILVSASIAAISGVMTFFSPHWRVLATIALTMSTVAVILTLIGVRAVVYARFARRKIRAAWHKLEGWSMRWMTRQRKWARVHFKLLRKKVRRSPQLARAKKYARVQVKLMWRKVKRQNKKTLTTGILLITTFIGLSIWFDNAFKGIVNQIHSFDSPVIDWNTAGLVVLGVAVAILLNQLLRNSTVRGRVGGLPWKDALKTVALLAVLLVVGLYAYSWWNAPKAPRVAEVKPPSVEEVYPSLVTAGREWTPWYYAPSNYRLDAQRRDENVAYEAQVNEEDSEPHKFARGPIVHVEVPRLRKIRFRVTDPDVSTVKFDLTYTPLSSNKPERKRPVTPPETPEEAEPQAESAPDQTVAGASSFLIFLQSLIEWIPRSNAESSKD